MKYYYLFIVLNPHKYQQASKLSLSLSLYVYIYKYIYIWEAYQHCLDLEWWENSIPARAENVASHSAFLDQTSASLYKHSIYLSICLSIHIYMHAYMCVCMYVCTYCIFWCFDFVYIYIYIYIQNQNIKKHNLFLCQGFNTDLPCKILVKLDPSLCLLSYCLNLGFFCHSPVDYTWCCISWFKENHFCEIYITDS